MSKSSQQAQQSQQSHQAQVGYRIPGNITLFEDAPNNQVQMEQLLANKKIVLFGIWGAFIPNCSQAQLPGFIRDYEKYKEKGVDEIICVTTNDPFVVHAWKKTCPDLEGKVRLLSDATGELTKNLGLEADMSNMLGITGQVRSKHFVSYVENGEIKLINVVEDPNVNLSDTFLKQCKA